MIIDKNLEFSDGQAVTTTAASDSYIDQLAAGDAVDSLWLYVLVDVAFVTADSATLTVSLQCHEDASFGAGTVTLYETAALAATALTADTVLCKVRVPAGAERYLRVYYTVGTGSFSAGNIDACLVKDVEAGFPS
jgi:hypothetical protein